MGEFRGLPSVRDVRDSSQPQIGYIGMAGERWRWRAGAGPGPALGNKIAALWCKNKDERGHTALCSDDDDDH